ncbi:hypothetical protein [Vulcanococcus limneticus]|uniref:hypothetical protein n=1 Tax=Vulcanococcus limneticus TaxID=2170428 RepID=UPI00398BDA5F
MTSFPTSFPASRPHPSCLNRRPQGVLIAGGFALTCLLSTPAQAVDQYCARTNPGLCTLNNVVGFASNSDTYFWSPVLQPSPTFPLSNFVGKVKKLTLRGSSNVTINANGNSTQAEVLIGSLGTNTLQGGNSSGVGPDTFVVGNPPATVNCQTSGVNCTASGIQGGENDRVILSTLNSNIIYIDRCLQMTAPYAAGQPGRGGAAIATATKANSADDNFAPITDVTGTCPVASLGINALQATALRGREALLTPWERLWSTTAPWSQGLHWLQQAMVALIQGPHARAAEPSITPQRYRAQARLQIPTYEGVTRVIQKDPRGNFLRTRGERGSTIVVNAGNLRFNKQILQPSRSNGTVYKQIGSEPIPLNRGLVFVYHEPIGILASYPNDRYPYGSERNRGNVIAQFVLGDATALPARSIDYVLLKNLNQSEGGATITPTTTGRPIKTNP